MDVIINIIIVIFVISSVLKRFQEVSKKSGDVTKPSPPLRERPDVPPLPHVTGDATPEPSTEPVTQHNNREPEVKSLKDLVDYLKDEYQQVEAPSPQPELPVAAIEPEPVLSSIEQPSPMVSEKVLKVSRAELEPERAISPSLTFSSEQVVNGIILSEVLGPPVALRNNASPGMFW